MGPPMLQQRCHCFLDYNRDMSVSQATAGGCQSPRLQQGDVTVSQATAGRCYCLLGYSREMSLSPRLQWGDVTVSQATVGRCHGLLGYSREMSWYPRLQQGDVSHSLLSYSIDMSLVSQATDIAYIIQYTNLPLGKLVPLLNQLENQLVKHAVNQANTIYRQSLSRAHVISRFCFVLTSCMRQ